MIHVSGPSAWARRNGARMKGGTCGDAGASRSVSVLSARRIFGSSAICAGCARSAGDREESRDSPGKFPAEAASSQRPLRSVNAQWKTVPYVQNLMWRLTMMDDERYDSTAITLHWSIALLILAAFGLGLTVDEFPKAWKSGAINAHALIGLAVLALSLARLIWRRSHPAPELPSTMGPLERVAAKLIHLSLYVLMIVVPVIGVPTLLFRGRGLDFGLFHVASPFARTPEIFRPLTEAHEIASYALIALAAAHAVAALYHQFVRRDDLLARMAPRRAPGV
jgi:cytochrome b561